MVITCNALMNFHSAVAMGLIRINKMTKESWISVIKWDCTMRAIEVAHLDRKEKVAVDRYTSMSSVC